MNLATALILVLAAGEPAQDSARTELIYLGTPRPVRISLQAIYDGKPVAEIHAAGQRAGFAFLDRDNDGKLDAEEAKGVPTAVMITQRLTGNFFFYQAGFEPLESLDRDKNGSVSFDEYAEHFRKSGAAAVRVIGAANRNPMGEVLRRKLDRDNDGKLSKEELARAPELIRLDEDEDDLIASNELGAGVNPNVYAGNGGGVVARGGNVRGVAPPDLPADGPWMVLETGRTDLALTKRLLAVYDRNNDRKLDRKEFALDDAGFAAIDVDGNGSIDGDELFTRYPSSACDLELIVRLGKRLAEQAGVEVVRAKGVKPRIGGVGTVTVDGTDAALELGSLDGAAAGRFDTKAYYAQQFRGADKDNNGYLEESEVKGNQFFVNLFVPADRDKDGKLYLKEIEAMLDGSAQSVAGCTVLTITDFGRSLFELFDADGDTRLSLRELRTAPTRMAVRDANADGFVSADELPGKFRLMFARAGQQAFVNPGLGMQPPASGPRKGAGPIWFQRMDLNNDGDVSPREFLGTDAQFRKIDADGDGLIDRAEADRADAELRKPAK